MTAQQKHKKDVFEIINEHIIDFLSSGIIPWRMPWSEGRIPTNLITRTPYRAINVFLLAAESFTSNLFLSEKQLANIGGTIPEGVGPILATHWEWVDKQAKEGEPKPYGKFASLRYHKIFNVSQCENIDTDKLPGYDRPPNPFKEAGNIFVNMPERPKVEYYTTEAKYDPVSDIVFMPDSKEYGSKELYYYDFFRFLIHSTGHEKRLKRKELTEENALISPFSRETLIADMGAHYLCYYSGMHKVPLKNNLDFIYQWIDTFGNDTRMAISAAVQAQKAVDCILNLRGLASESVAEEHGQEMPNDEETDEISQ